MTDRTTVAQLVIDRLTEAGVEHLFCLPGVQNDDFFNVLVDSAERLRPVMARHEQTTAYMALGAALATGRPSAFCVVPGPGVLNTTAALATGYAANARMFGLIGQLPSRAIGKGYGLLHEIPDQAGVLKGLTKFSARVETGAAAGPVMGAAMRALTGGRPRPVAVEVPQDVWVQPASGGPVDAPAVKTPDPEKVEEAARILADAERPLIMVGGGAQDAGPEIRALAERLNAPVGYFRMGKGVIPADHAMDAPGPVAHRLWGACDVVLAIGTRLSTPYLVWGADDRFKVIHANIDPAAPNHIRPAALGIETDAAAFARALTEALGPAPAREEWLATVGAVKAEVAARMQAAMGPQIAWLNAIRAAMPREAIFCEEMTQVGYAARAAFPVHVPRGYIASGYQGTLGAGFPTALGVAHVRRDVPVVSINGDGGVMFAISELATAVKHSIPLTAIVFRDESFGNVKRFQQEKYGGNRTIAVDFANPDFVALAKSYGVPGRRAETPEALGAAVAAGIASGGPSLIEVPVGEFPSPWEFILMPKIRGAA